MKQTINYLGTFGLIAMPIVAAILAFGVYFSLQAYFGVIDMTW